MSHGPFVCRGRFSFIPSARRVLCLLRPPLTSSVFRIVTVASCGGSSRFSFCNDFVFFSPWTSAHTLDALPPSGGGLGPGAGVQRANPGCWTRRAPQPSSSTSHAPPRLGDGDAGKSRRGERGRLTGAASPLGRDRRACRLLTWAVAQGRVCGGQPWRRRPRLPRDRGQAPPMLAVKAAASPRPSPPFHACQRLSELVVCLP